MRLLSGALHRGAVEKTAVPDTYPACSCMVTWPCHCRSAPENSAGLAGTAPTCTLWQRINVMQVFRLLSVDANLLLFFVEQYDLQEVGTLLQRSVHVWLAMEALSVPWWQQSALPGGVLLAGWAAVRVQQLPLNAPLHDVEKLRM